MHKDKNKVAVSEQNTMIDFKNYMTFSNKTITQY